MRCRGTGALGLQARVGCCCCLEAMVQLKLSRPSPSNGPCSACCAAMRLLLWTAARCMQSAATALNELFCILNHAQSSRPATELAS